MTKGVAKACGGVMWVWMRMAAWMWMAVGCASYSDKTAAMRHSFEAGQYQTALDELETAQVSEGRNRLLYTLEKATILAKTGDFKKSRLGFQEADRLVDELYTTSITNTAATFLVNEAMQDYEGEVFEKTAIHTMLALSYIETNELDQAVVEARRVNHKLKQFASQLGEDSNSYKEDGFARYLAGMIFEAHGQTDDALIDYQGALKLYRNPEYQAFNGTTVPKDLVRATYGLALSKGREDILATLKPLIPKDTWWPPGQAQVIVIHELGHVTPKRAHEFMWPIQGQWIRFSFPVIDQVSTYPLVSQVGVELGQRKRFYAEEAQSLNALAHHALEERRGRLLVKGAVRLLAKGQLTERAYKSFGVWGGLVANIVSAVTETADTRSWTTLPASIAVTRLWLPPGPQELTMYGSYGRVVDIKSLDLKPGEVVLLRAGRR